MVLLVILDYILSPIQCLEQQLMADDQALVVSVEAGSSASLTLANLPPIYLLPTRLDQSELQRLQDQIRAHRGSLIDDPAKARLFIGRVATRQRAEFELRCRAVWTENAVGSVWDAERGTTERPWKRLRLAEADNGTDGNKVPLPVEGSSTTSELETVARRGQPDEHQPVPTDRESARIASEAELIRVIKLDWLLDCLKAGELCPLDPYTVYSCQPIAPPGRALTRGESPTVGVGVVFPSRSMPTRKSPTLKQGELQAILERAKADAAGAGKQHISSYHQAGRYARLKASDGHSTASAITSSQRYTRRTNLLQQSTSEHDEGISSEMPEMPDWVKEGKIYACQRSTPPDPPNKGFIGQLRKIKLARLLTGDEIGVRAYSTSIAAIAAYPYVLRSTKEILALPGCDIKIAHLFSEWKSNDGYIEEVDNIEKDEALSVLRVFYKIWGVGASTAREFYYQRHWREMDDVIEYGWNTLSRVQQIGVKYYDEFLEKIPRREVEFIASKVLEHAKKVRDDGIEMCVVGGYRRGKAESGDVDMILSHRHEAKTLNLVRDVVASLEQEGWITHTLLLSLTGTKRDQSTLPFSGADKRGHGFDTLDKALVVWQDINYSNPDGTKPAKNPNIHRRVDIIISPWRTVGCAITGWSGETTFQRDLRRYVRKVKGWKFDSSGVRDRATGHVVDLEGAGGVSRTWMEAERKVFEGMGLEFREPWERCTG